MPGLPHLDVPLTDGVVTLREWHAADVAAMTEHLNDAEIAHWAALPSPYTRADAEDYFAEREPKRESGECLSLVMVSASTDEVLGSIGLEVTSWEHLRGELGYIVFAHARGRAVATRAVRLLARFSLKRLGLLRLEILADPRNRASQRVAEKAGFTREGVLRSHTQEAGERRDMVSWSLLPDELEDV